MSSAVGAIGAAMSVVSGCISFGSPWPFQRIELHSRDQAPHRVGGRASVLHAGNPRAQILSSISDVSSVRSRSNTGTASLRDVASAMKFDIGRGAIAAAAASDARTALTRRRSQRTALGRLISSPRSPSAAASMLRAEPARMTLFSIEASNPGKRAARKSGSRLNVLWPSGQYHRAIRTPGVVSRS